MLRALPEARRSCPSRAASASSRSSSRRSTTPSTTRRCGASRPEFTLKPSEYFARQVYGCYFFEELAPQHLLDRIGVDNVLFETDYPHPVCLYGNVREKIDAGLAGQPERVQRKLLFENAARLYRVAKPDRAWAGVQ